MFDSRLRFLQLDTLAVRYITCSRISQPAIFSKLWINGNAFHNHIVHILIIAVDFIRNLILN